MLGMEEVSTSEERAFKIVVSIVLPLIFLICTLESVEFHRHLNAQDEPLSEGEMPEENVPFWIDP